jgi:hypothetical protein
MVHGFSLLQLQVRPRYLHVPTTCRVEPHNNKGKSGLSVSTDPHRLLSLLQLLRPSINPWLSGVTLRPFTLGMYRQDGMSPATSECGSGRFLIVESHISSGCDPKTARYSLIYMQSSFPQSGRSIVLQVNLTAFSFIASQSFLSRGRYRSEPAGNQYILSSPVTRSGSTPSLFSLPF